MARVHIKFIKARQDLGEGKIAQICINKRSQKNVFLHIT